MFGYGSQLSGVASNDHVPVRFVEKSAAVFGLQTRVHHIALLGVKEQVYKVAARYQMPLVIVASWGIAFFEYWLAVPANRWGSTVYTAAQLKTMQEVITLVVFAGFSVLYLKEPLGWNHALGFAFIAIGAFFIFHKWA